MSHRVVPLGCVQHRVQRDGCAFTQGTDLPRNAPTQLSWQGAPATFSRRAKKPARGEGHSSPGSSREAFWPIFCKAEGDWELEVVERTPGMRGISVLPKRWIVERTFGWLARNRRMSKDYERKIQTSETLTEVAMIRLLVARLGYRS
jgi:transposase